MPVRTIRLSVSLCVVAGLLSGCAQGPLSTQEGRLGSDDGTDSCRPQLVALDSTGDYFGAQILAGAGLGAVGGAMVGGLIGGDWKGALIGAAAGGALGAAGGYWSALQQQRRDQAGLFSQVTDDLTRENAQIDRTQLAFDQLMQCRFRQAQAINADYKSRRITRDYAQAAMDAVNRRTRAELDMARRINDRLNSRGEEFTVAAENLTPTAPAAPATVAPARAVAAKPVTLRRPVPLKLTPDPAAPDIGQLQARQVVNATPSRSGYVLVETAKGERGYAPVADVQGALAPAAPIATASGDPRQLAGSNAARRDSFAQSVAVSEKATASGFELAG